MPSEFPELQKLQVTQLERLIKDEIAMKAHASKLDCVETLRSIRDDLCKSNADDARRNLQKRGDAGTEEEEILILQNKLRAVASAYKAKLGKYESQHAMSKEAIISQLNGDLTSIDNRSEDMAQDFVRGQNDVNTFLEEYLKVRAQYHSLKLTITKAK
jgi:hypothetical protein